MEESPEEWIVPTYIVPVFVTVFCSTPVFLGSINFRT